jgi:Xaa-Pro aminopeptidase
MPDPTIPLSEYAARRNKLLTALKQSVGLVYAGDLLDPLHDDFRPHPHFEYLTGITDEPGAALLLDPTHPVESRRAQLYLRPLNPEVEKWDGYRLEVSKALREKTGFKAIFRLGNLGRFLNEAARRSKSLACLHPLAFHDQPVSPDLDTFRKVAERIPGAEITDRTEILAKLRAVKSAKEVAMIQRSIDITAEGFEAILRFTRPGMNEFDVQEHLEHAYRTNGSRGPAFGTIVGAGVNSTVLHYRANDQPIAEDDLICIDSGAGFRGYGADITRTIPASGKFTRRQREIYEIVLAAEAAAIKSVKPGATLAQIDKIARAVIVKAGYGDDFIHGIGHHLGLETHDITPDGALKPGNVITIEPGIYLPDERIGVRIEDDVLVTKDGHRVLSSKIPKSVAAIEKVMAG